MKKFVVVCSLAMLVSMVGCGCGSMSSCWSRNGSRVPVAAGAGTPVSAPAISAPIMDGQMVYSSGCNPCAPVSNACNPCGAATCGACDPCGSSSSGYPMGGTMPGPAAN